MVGIVVVSHSEALAEGVVTLARQMASSELALEPAGGFDEQGSLGTNPERVRAAIERAMSPDGVLVLMDLGSALMSAEFAVELLEGTSGPVKLSSAPLVEGTVAAAVAATGGATLEDVAAEADRALAMKAADVGAEAAPTPEASPAKAGKTLELPVKNAIGLHARPAARFVNALRPFDVRVEVSKAGADQQPVSARSLTNLMALRARRGDTLVVTATGADADAALDALRELADSGFGDGFAAHGIGARDDAASDPDGDYRPDDGSGSPAAGTVLHGIAAASGVAIGSAQRLGGGPAGPPPARPPEAPDAELTLLEGAVDAVRSTLIADRDRLAARTSADEAAIFDAHLALLDDEALLEPARVAIGAGATAEAAIHDAAAQIAEVYRGLGDPLLAERAVDALDVGRRLVAAATGEPRAATGGTGVVITDELTPSQSAGFDPALVTAIATARGSVTAHAAIIARSLGIPAVVGLGQTVLAVPDDTPLLVDGQAGTVTIAPSQEAIDAGLGRDRVTTERRNAALARAGEPACLASGERIDVLANVGSLEDASRAVELGAEGVGMLRTEFLYLDRPELPTEDEQAATFAEIARVLDGRPLIIRTLDAGADKPLPSVPMPAEDNPFLGVRGIRVGLAQPEVLRPQLRAALRVAADHPVKLMMPMVATLGEVLAVRELLEDERRSLRIDAPMEFGVTLEVPSSALMAERLARHVDFFSLGTNDLTQYTMAAERGDSRLAPLLANPQPAVLRLVRMVVEGAAGAPNACWVGICGEMGGDPASAVLLVGLGVTELSMAPPMVPEMKATLRRITLTDARAAVQRALGADDADQARAIALELID